MLNTTKILRAGQPVWSAYPAPAIPAALLESTLQTEILIIGAGVSGAFMAEALASQGFGVAVIDKREPLTGSTMATTALLQYEIDEPLTKLSGLIGQEKAGRAWLRSRESLRNLAEHTHALGIACDWRDHATLYLAGNALDPAQLALEGAARRALGFECTKIGRQELKERFGVDAEAALESPGSYSANPRALAAGYLLSATQKGAKIFSPVEADALTIDKTGIHLRTKQGIEIKARKIIFTCGYEVPKYLKNQDYKIYSTWAFATEADQAYADTPFPLIWQASDPYLYMRRMPDGRLIAGGEDEEHVSEETRNALLPAKIATLQKKIHGVLPQANLEAAFKWCGSFGVTSTGLPLMGAVPGVLNAYALLSFGGNGITFSRIGAEVIGGLISGKADKDADLFAFKS